MNRIFLDWIELKSLHETTVAKSMYIWFAVVPLLANIISKLEILFSETPLLIKASLPVTLSILFFGALCMVVSNVTYNIFCPGILKDHSNFKSFSDAGKNLSHLIEYRDKAFEQEQTFEAGWQDSNFENPENESLKDKYWRLHSRSKHSNPTHRRFCMWCFLIALACLAVGSVLNIASVMQQIW